jgi:hypothetical protein
MKTTFQHFMKYMNLYLQYPFKYSSKYSSWHTILSLIICLWWYDLDTLHTTWFLLLTTSERGQRHDHSEINDYFENFVLVCFRIMSVIYRVVGSYTDNNSFTYTSLRCISNSFYSWETIYFRTNVHIKKDHVCICSDICPWLSSQCM